MKHSLVFFGYAVASLGLAFIALLLYITFCIPDCNRGQSASVQKPVWREQVSLQSKSRYRLIRTGDLFHHQPFKNKKPGLLKQNKSFHSVPGTIKGTREIYLFDKRGKYIQKGNTAFPVTAE